jgi:cytidylate kinase
MELRSQVEQEARAARRAAPELDDAAVTRALGRAAALVLAEYPGALHVRLDGPKERRIAQAARFGRLEEAEARRRQHDADRARASYVKHLYHADPADPRHYHLVLDSTALGFDACVELIVFAAGARSTGPSPAEIVR